MITSIHIENFKSIQSLDLELGRLNIFIGANGCGKSNILEAIAMGSAAMEDKLDDAFLVNRGVRVTEPRLMKAGFNKSAENMPVHILWANEFMTYNLELTALTGHFSKWEAKTGFEDKKVIIEDYKSIVEDNIKNREEREGGGLLALKEKAISHAVKNFSDVLDKSEKDPDQLKFLIKEGILKKWNLPDFLNFLIYAPENHFLRRFEEETAIKPLGIKGEGLFKLITIIAQEYPEQFAEIKKHLKLIDWFDDFEIPGDLKFTERRIKIKDQYLGDDLQYFDQRSANEGFLYLLFYLTLFISNETPHFFAIDNIDNSLNPKLGSELIKILAQLAKDHNKQAILTTHNPVILDGLDLDDPDQRLFVVYRNADGHTKARRIPPQKSQNGIEPVRLSEAFIRGYIGGLPDNF